MDQTNQLAEVFSIEGKIEKFEDKMAVIKTADGQELRWPIKNLPEDIEVGSPVRLVLSTTQTIAEERDKIAKNILNQILKTNTQNENSGAGSQV